MPLQKKIEFASWIFLAFFLFLGGLFASANFTLGILTGGLISILNFYGLCHGLKGAFGKLETGVIGKSALMLKYMLRLVLTGLALYLVLVKTSADIFGLIIGLSTVILGVIASVVMTVIDKSYLEEV
jgi:hypothetical protein